MGVIGFEEEDLVIINCKMVNFIKEVQDSEESNNKEEVVIVH